jgi:F-type H+-transporting ATPase subunit delta
MNSKNTKIAQPYAEAFLELATKNSLETTINDLNCLSTSLANSSDLKKLLSNPLVNSENKKSIIKSIFTDKIDNTTLKFLLVLCDRGRISYLSSIVEKSIELAYKAASIEIVKVTSSTPFSPSQQEALTSKLKKMTGAEQIKLEINTNPDLIGGFIVQVGSKIIDTSIQGQLRDLSSYLGASVL